MFHNYAELWERIAGQVPDRTAVVAGDRRLSYRQFEDNAIRLAEVLLARGLAPGSRIAFFLYNCAEYLTVMYAALKIEAVPVPINYRYRTQEVTDLLAASGPAALVYPASLAGVVHQLAVEPSLPELLFEVGDGPDIDSRAQMSRAAESWDRRPESIDLENVAATLTSDASMDRRRTLPVPGPNAELLIFTGGTTGLPKAVVWGLGDLLQVQQSSIYGPIGVAEPATIDEAVRVATDETTPPTVTLSLAPVVHATALFSVMNTFALGGTVVILPTPSLDSVTAARVLREESVTRLIVAGDAVAQPILDVLGDRSLEHLSVVISSGMRFSDETKARLHRLAHTAIVDILASTEGGPYAIATSVRESDLPSCFLLTPDAVVLNDRGQEIQDHPGDIGILGFKGALPKGYLDDPEATASIYPIINGVRHVVPGDYVKVLPDRYIELLGRGSSVVNTGGEKVYPAEIEEVLLEHPSVNDAVVFGVRDIRFGEAVVAVVAAARTGEATEQTLRAFVGNKLAGYKKPRRISVRSSLDRGPSGKIDIRALRRSVES